MRLVCALLGILVFISNAEAEIEKVAIPSEKGTRLFWWPKVASTEGWHQDRESSYLFGVNAFAPDGFTFKNADTVIYARAEYKPRLPKISSLDSLIASDREHFEATVPGVLIQETAPLVTADGMKLRSFTFFPTQGGNWERVAYGEEGEFYLIFTVSSKSSGGLNSAGPAYEKLVSGYRK